MVTDTSLIINNVQEDHGGMYQCVARNKLGMAYATSLLDVRQHGDNTSRLAYHPARNQMQDIAPDSALRGKQLIPLTFMWGSQSHTCTQSVKDDEWLPTILREQVTSNT